MHARAVHARRSKCPCADDTSWHGFSNPCLCVLAQIDFAKCGEPRVGKPVPLFLPALSLLLLDALPARYAQQAAVACDDQESARREFARPVARQVLRCAETHATARTAHIFGHIFG